MNFVMDRLRNLFWLSVKYNFRLRAMHIPGVINQLADSISRLHEPGQIFTLALAVTKLVSYVTVVHKLEKPYVLCFFSAHSAPSVQVGLKAELAVKVALYRSATFSDNTKRTYKSQLKSYLDFCAKVDESPVPVSEETLCAYAAYLSDRLKPNSICQYLNVVRLVHIECGYDNPLDSWLLSSTLKGIRRIHGDSVTRKEPITPRMLSLMKKKLDMTNILDIHFWAECVVLFFGMFRKSNLFPTTLSAFDPSKQFTRSDFMASRSSDIYITVRWSKTFQCWERQYKVKLPSLDNPLSPADAVRHALDSVHLSADSVLSVRGTPMTGRAFNQKFHSVIKDCGFNTQEYSSHNFRRRSAVWAIQCGLPTEMVKYMGDWKSGAYLNYVDSIPRFMMEFYSQRFCSNLPLEI